MTATLPEPGSPVTYRIALVCLGNICRSPMAHVVLASRVEEAGLADRVRVESFGTGDWHVGRPMDPRAAAVLTTEGYDATRHRARTFGVREADAFDLVLAMDRANHEDLVDLGVDASRLRLFRSFDPDVDLAVDSGVDPGGEGAGADVPDPYYGDDDGFDEVLTIVERTSARLVDLLERQTSPA
ncbi:MAG: low molecular weight protein-tyrosine-phosphatase [Nocardioides sp.]